VGSVDDTGLGAALTRLVARAGEPAIRRGVDLVMRMMGEQFVTGQTIEEALKRARTLEEKGFGYSYDMLGEAATTAADAQRYYRDYETAIHAIGKASNGRGVYGGPGISIKLSALHPRYSRAQAGRVMGELLPLVRDLALLSKSYDIGLNIDAEEADRLELSLDLLESLALDPELADWNGLGFVVQAYGKRCPSSSTGSSIWAAGGQADHGASGQGRLLGRRDQARAGRRAGRFSRLYAQDPYRCRLCRLREETAGRARRRVPQFATHNAQTLATIYHLAGPDFAIGRYEFQCLHGMGEPLYRQVVGKGGLDRPCRIYAPVGTHETLLAYLVRRLLENGANSSFVNRIADPAVSLDEMVADPVDVVRAMPMPGLRHDLIALPGDLYAGRRNSSGIDLSDEQALATLSQALKDSASMDWRTPVPCRIRCSTLPIMTIWSAPPVS
jgi:RHH-type proline utilization regulon transcriptional repressor/proline dehydrogenase/delta 1-pyrroline-5-carboxylate dehydrogenase